MLNDSKSAGEGNPSYAYKPSLIGTPWVFSLRERGLHWTKGTRSGEIAYRDISRMRLSLRPASMLFDRYRLEIWPAAARRIEIISASHKTLVEQEKQGAQFSAFVVELHRRVTASGAQVRFDAGVPFILYWAGVAIFAATSIAIGGLVVRALLTSAWIAAAFIAVFLGFFLWQATMFFRRNRPAAYTADKMPERLLPRS